jgi:glycosyltransferase involved in cell wall biosynthesis
VVRLSRKGLPGLRVVNNLRRLASRLAEIDRESPIDILEGGELDLFAVNRSAPGLKVLRMHGGPHFFATGPRPRVIGGLKERWAFHVADELCAVSHYVAEETRRLLGLGERRIEVIPNPIDTNAFQPSAVEEEGLIAFAGTVNERKGIRYLVRAMPRIVAAVPAARLEVYGGDSIDADSGKPFSQMAAGLIPPEIAARVHWKGRVQRAELPRTLGRASVGVYPSLMEAHPIAWLEGLALGKAVVASKTGPGPEVIDDGITGLLCDPRDPDSIAEKVIQVLLDATLRRRLGAAARRSAVERYALEPLVDRNLEYYQRITNGRGALKRRYA